MWIVRAARAATYQRRIDDVLRVKESVHGTDDRLAYQLRCFNARWAEIRVTVPFYQDLAARMNLPREFRSWDQFREVMPTSNRQLVQRYTKEMSSQERGPDFLRTTGGSTGEPVQLPAWRSEAYFATADLWYGRQQYGIGPSARLFALWGHSHLMGKGLRGWRNRAERRLRDQLIGFHRFSAYDLSPAAMQKAAEAMVRFRPDFVLGYGVALDTFARVNSHLQDQLRALRVKAVVGAAERFPFPDSASRLQELFDAPVAMEYGSVETNLIAHTRPPGGYEVFWWRYFLELEPDSASHGPRAMYVTSLYPRCFPLVRYALGDEIVTESSCGETAGLASFDRVMGRCNDYVTLPGGDSFHSEFFTHAVRGSKEILGYQVAQTASGVRLALTGGPGCDGATVLRVKANLVKVDRRLEAVDVVIVPELIRTRAGKSPMVVKP